MIYYHIRVYTPFCGEEADVYIQAFDENNYHRKAHNAAQEKVVEGYYGSANVTVEILPLLALLI